MTGAVTILIVGSGATIRLSDVATGPHVVYRAVIDEVGGSGGVVVERVVGTVRVVGAYLAVALGVRSVSGNGATRTVVAREFIRHASAGPGGTGCPVTGARSGVLTIVTCATRTGSIRHHAAAGASGQVRSFCDSSGGFGGDLRAIIFGMNFVVGAIVGFPCGRLRCGSDGTSRGDGWRPQGGAG